MDEFGFLSPGERPGMLDDQRLRAVRVILDLGIHLDKSAFGRYGGGIWDHDKCWQLLRGNVVMEENQLRFELHRYLGWAGQTPNCRIDQRIWEQIRNDAARRAGQEFDLHDSHDRALAVGLLPSDVLCEVLARQSDPVLTMQDALRTLSDYWTLRGCLTWQPHDSEVGAGTMNPATVLRVLGPKPWGVTYVEPSVRPNDSRYGENPNRLQTYTQFQVILKSEPSGPQKLYLGSLETLGIDLNAHDMCLVKDNWAQPAIGAWGLGWEV